MDNITLIKKKNNGDKKYINSDIFKKKIIQPHIEKKNNNLFKKNNSFSIPIKNNINEQKKDVHNNKPKNIIANNVNIKNNLITNKIIKKPLKIIKKILIYQYQNMHTEVMGTIIYNLKKLNINIYHPHKTNPSNSIPYYEKIFNKKIFYVDEINEDLYDLIIVLTSGEINLLKPKNENKYIIINHENGTVQNKYINISLTPIVQSDFFILPIYDFENKNERNNQICIIGSLYDHQRDLQNIQNLIEILPDYNICLFTRHIEEKNKNTFFKYSNFRLYEKIDTTSMVTIIRQSKFIFTADTENYTENGVRGGILTGMIPLALNNNIPLIMTKRLNVIYNLTGVLLYDKNIIELKKKLNNLNDDEYNILIKNTNNDTKRICLENEIKFEIILDNLSKL